MSLDQHTGEEITLVEAQGYVAEFAKQFPDEVKSFFVGSILIESILAQEDCIGLRAYNGYDDAEGRMNIVFVGVDTDENDMKNGIIVDRCAVCPPVCPTISIMD
ncbi:hypothetical protein [Flavobacterium sp.]|uniref:hypothetical protein n=1 Tax=Flavobacterium sp. TaxID=239 RepID=UPI002634CBF8|nr:hypothetical protein [Flavobacterium sp.]